MKIAERVEARLTEWGTLVALALCATTLSAASDHQGFAKVHYVFGNAVFSRGNAPAQKLERYMVLHPGDTIKTDANSHVDLALGYNNGTLQVTPKSELTLEKLTYENTILETVHNTQLTLKSGSVVGVVNKMSAGSKYEIKSPRGVAGIRGTIYGLWDNGNVGVTRGQVVQALTLPDGTAKPMPVKAGQMLVAGTSEVRALTTTEKKSINGIANDSMTHGGYSGDMDADTVKFFQDAQNAPPDWQYLPPTSGAIEAPTSPFGR
jgi:hypothetical protein